MRITCVSSHLWGGGAERVLCILASGWAQQGHEVTILTFQTADARSYPLHSSVQVRHLALMSASANLIKGLFQNLRRVRVLRRAIRDSQPDIVVSFLDQTNVLTLLAARGLPKPVIVTEHIDPSHYHIGPIWSGLRRLLYPSADFLVCPSGAALAKFQAIIRVRGRAIPDPIAVPNHPRLEPRNSTGGGHTLIAMGRLAPQKGFDLLLQAFSRIAGRHPDWSLTIVGFGPLRSELEEQSRSLNLADRVRFAGEVTDPFPLLRAADLFVFSSRFEGFGMALAEAMACGLPAVSFDCPSGPGEIIRHEVDGILVPPEDINALAAALDRLMSDPEERKRLAARAPEAEIRFSPEKILAQWQELFDQLLSPSADSH